MALEVDPDWSLDEAVKAAFKAYIGYGIQSRGYRNNVLRAWAGAVGRDKALEALDDFVEMHGGPAAAAGVLRIEPSTLRTLKRDFARVRVAAAVPVEPNAAAGDETDGQSTDGPSAGQMSAASPLVRDAVRRQTALDRIAAAKATLLGFEGTGLERALVDEIVLPDLDYLADVLNLEPYVLTDLEVARRQARGAHALLERAQAAFAKAGELAIAGVIGGVASDVARALIF